MKKEQRTAINLTKMELCLVEPDDDVNVPFATKISINKQAQDTYSEAFKDRWEVLINMYIDLVREANAFLVEGIDIMIKENGKKKEKIN